MPPSAHAVDTPERGSSPALTCFRLSTPTGAIRLMLVGELDLVTAPRARAAVRDAQADTRELLCDLGDVWFVDLAGMRVLLDAAAHAKLTGGHLAVTNCPPSVPRMLQLLRLEDWLDIRPAPRSADAPPECVAIRRHVG